MIDNLRAVELRLHLQECLTAFGLREAPSTLRQIPTRHPPEEESLSPHQLFSLTLSSGLRSWGCVGVAFDLFFCFFQLLVSPSQNTNYLQSFFTEMREGDRVEREKKKGETYLQ